MLKLASSVAVVFLLACTAAGEPGKNVLILHEGSRLLPYQEIASRELQKDLTSDKGLIVEIFEEFLDTWRLGDDPPELTIALQTKYAGQKVDVVVADGVAALELLLHNPPKFLQGTPVVFLSMSDVHLPPMLPPNITGVVTHVDYTGTIRLATTLQPDLRHIYYIESDPQLDAVAGEMLKHEFAPFREKLDVTMWVRVDLLELLARVSSLPPHSAILFDAYAQSPGGQPYVPAQVCSLISASTNAPLYSPYSTLIGNGAIAGVVMNFESISHQTSRLILRLLHGGRVSDFPVEQSRNEVMADWRQLQRFHLDERLLPPGAIVLYRVPTVWERYRWYIVLAGVVILFELALIIKLMAEAKRRKQSEAASRELAGRLINAQEEERRRIARDLHDDLSQRLAWTCIQLDTMRESPLERERLVEKLTELYEETDLMSSDLHQISHELHPAVLERLGLIPALRQYSEEFAQHRKVAVTMNSPTEEPPVSKEGALALFRVAQECLTNVAKHSGATSCEVKLNSARGRVTLEVADKGRGFEPAELNERAGLGIESMRERLRSVGGTLHITSSPATGTAVRAEIPVSELDTLEKDAEREPASHQPPTAQVA